MKFTEAIEAARLRAGQMLREHRERIAEKRAEKAAATAPGAAPMLWIWFLVFVAATALLGSTWMLVVFIAGSVGHVDWTFDWRNGSDGVRRANWSAEANVHALIGVGLFLASAAVAAYNAVWLHVRHYINGLFKTAVTGIGIFVALFMISGAIVVQQWGTDDRARDAVAVTQTAQVGVASAQAELGALEHRWEVLCAPTLTTWQAQACRSGEAAWSDRVGIARSQYRANDPTLQLIERAIADAREGDRMQARMVTLRGAVQAASVTTVQAQVQTVQATGWFAQFSHVLEDLRKPAIAVLGELLAMTMFGVALAALRSRRMADGFGSMRQHPWMLEDKQAGRITPDQVDKRSAQDVVDAMIAGGADPRFAADMARSALRQTKPQEEMFDAATGERLHYRKGTWAKPPKRKGRSPSDEAAAGEMVFMPEGIATEDEVGVPTGTGDERMGSTAAGLIDVSGFQELPDIIEGSEENSDVQSAYETARPAASDVAADHEDRAHAADANLEPHDSPSEEPPVEEWSEPLAADSISADDVPGNEPAEHSDAPDVGSAGVDAESDSATEAHEEPGDDEPVHDDDLSEHDIQPITDRSRLLAAE